jgi:hypothetical protein
MLVLGKLFMSAASDGCRDLFDNRTGCRGYESVSSRAVFRVKAGRYAWLRLGVGPG